MSDLQDAMQAGAKRASLRACVFGVPRSQCHRGCGQICGQHVEGFVPLKQPVAPPSSGFATGGNACCGLLETPVAPPSGGFAAGGNACCGQCDKPEGHAPCATAPLG